MLQLILVLCADWQKTAVETAFFGIYVFILKQTYLKLKKTSILNSFDLIFGKKVENLNFWRHLYELMSQRCFCLEGKKTSRNRNKKKQFLLVLSRYGFKLQDSESCRICWMILKKKKEEKIEEVYWILTSQPSKVMLQVASPRLSSSVKKKNYIFEFVRGRDVKEGLYERTYTVIGVIGEQETLLCHLQ